MKQDHQALWQKILDFELDDPAASFPFSKKLAKEENWSMSFTSLAITEYKKFLLLCCISPAGASPSEIVDQVWHMHLTYTRNYWEELCSKVLHRPLHHYPSRGGVPEHNRHQAWYQETLLLYKEVFETDPPAAVWPAPVGKDLSTVTANYRKSIDIPADVWLKGAGLLILFLFFIELRFGVLNPFVLEGPAFIEFMLYLSMLSIGITILLLSHQGKGFQKLVQTISLETCTHYDMIELLHNKERAFQTAIVELVNHNLLEVSPAKKFISHVHETVSSPAGNPLLPALARDTRKSMSPGADDELSYEELRKLYQPDWSDSPNVSKLKWLTFQKFSWRWTAYQFVMLLFLIRIIQGAYHHQPIGFLFLSMLIYTLVYALISSYYTPANMLQEELRLKMEEDLAYTAPADKLMADFTNRGRYALAGMESYMVLAGIFALTSPSSRATANNDGDGGGGCSGGGGCGGCGGCGGS